MENNVLNENKNRIYIPQILIPKYYDAVIESSIGLRGELEWKLIETKRFSRPTVIMSGRQKNTIVNAGLDAWCNSTNAIRLYFEYIAVGTGSSTPSVTQTALDTQIARKQFTSRNYYYGPPPYCERECTFLENEANGNLTEWGTFQYSSGAPMFSRELFRDELGNPIVIAKTNTQQLWVKYRLYIQRQLDFTSVDKIIDGITYKCVATINDKQLYNLIYAWSTTVCKVVVGTSNTASDLINDNHNTIKGTQLFNAAPLVLPTWSHPGINQKQVTINLADTESNGQIGEVLVNWSYDASTSPVTIFYTGRVTFDPTLTKDSTKKLIITVLYSFGNGS